jgi:hypothetical protein
VKLGASAEGHFWKHFESAFVIGLEERRLDVSKEFDEKGRDGSKALQQTILVHGNCQSSAIVS